MQQLAGGAKGEARLLGGEAPRATDLVDLDVEPDGRVLEGMALDGAGEPDLVDGARAVLEGEGVELARGVAEAALRAPQRRVLGQSAQAIELARERDEAPGDHAARRWLGPVGAPLGEVVVGARGGASARMPASARVGARTDR